ncbi:MAG: YcjX family protein [Paracoccaceae bacterium]
MGLGDIADQVTRGVEGLGASLSETFFEPVVRLGVTGLARAGKTVFITSLVSNLLDRGRMGAIPAVSSGAIRAVYLQPQPHVTLPRFDYEAHRAALTGPDPHWPESTRSISELRLSFRIQPTGLRGFVSGLRTIHLDIVDYPGEWLLDLALLDKDYAQWSAEVLARLEHRAEATGYVAALGGVEGSAPLDEPVAQRLAAEFTRYLTQARAAGYSDCTPGRFLLPGDLAGSPVLTFAPLPKPADPPRKSLWREMERRYDAYRSRVVKPFFRDHFARIDRQVVLVDALGAIHAGPRAVEDMRRALAEILGAFRTGRNGFLSEILLGRRVEKLLIAATKADHLHHSQHARLTAIVQAMLREARDRADFSGAETTAMAIAALRATVEEDRSHDGAVLGMVRGRLADSDRNVALYPGELPADPDQILSAAHSGAANWLEGDFDAMRFAPARMMLKPGDGLPHIRLDRAAEFLIGDRLR